MLKDNKQQQDKAQDLLKSLKEEFDVTLTPQREVDDENKVEEGRVKRLLGLCHEH